jgi:hypothetical protein
MAEVLLEFDELFQGPNGESYEARVCGAPRADTFWEGWLEFTPERGGEVIRTGRETTQPHREDLRYWATGLTWGYVDGALRRVLTPPRATIHRKSVTSKPFYKGPADNKK